VTRTRWALAGLAVVAALAVVTVRSCGGDAMSAEEMRRKIAALEAEREELRSRVDALVASDPRLGGMPDTEVRFGVPTGLARKLITRVVSGFVDQVTLVLENLKVHKAGRVRKVITLGEYDLDVRIDRVSGRLRTGEPEIEFGGNQISVALPIQIASGSGDATIHFVWNGKNISGAVCGDMDVTETVGGGVKPGTYPVSGSLELTATTQQILAEPRFPPLKVNLEVEPSEESWAKVRALIESKGGLCGFVLDKVDIPGILERLVGRGFNVRLPTEKIKPMAIPVGIATTLEVRGEPITLEITVGGLAITEHVIWLGVDVDVALGDRALED